MKKEYTKVEWKPLDDPDKFRDMDRLEEAQRIPLTEAQEKIQEEKDPTLFDIIKKNPKMTYNEANKVLEDLKLKKEAGACITAGMKRDRDATDKMKNRPLTDTMDEIAYHELKKENEKLKETLKSRDYTKQHDYKFLVEENKKLQKLGEQMKKDHQYDNSVHKVELETLRKIK